MIRPVEPSPDGAGAEPAPELEYFRTSAAYRVELESFQGPLDLLLYLIQKDEIDIYDIPIAEITDQFLRYLDYIQLLDLDNAGDFLVMAATLMRIKTRMLLPVQAEEELTDEDPRAELVRRLLEYKRFKEAAEALRRCEEDRSRYCVRRSPFPFLTEAQQEPPQLRISLFELLSALAEIIDKLPGPRAHTVRREPFTVEQKIALIVERVQREPTVRFRDLFAEDAIRMEVVVTFIAILELCKRGLVRFYQAQTNGPIWLHMADLPAGGDDGPPPTRGEVEATAPAIAASEAAGEA